MPQAIEFPVFTIEKPSFIVCLLLIRQVLNFIVYQKERKISMVAAQFVEKSFLRKLFPTSLKLLDFLKRNPNAVRIRTTRKDRPQVCLKLDVSICNDYSIQKRFQFKSLGRRVTGEAQASIAKAIELHQQSLRQEFAIEHIQFIDQIQQRAKLRTRSTTHTLLNHSIRIEEEEENVLILANLEESKSNCGETNNLLENSGWNKSFAMSSPDLHCADSKPLKRNIYVELENQDKQQYFSWNKNLQSLTNEPVHLASSCPIQVEAPNRWQETKVHLIAAIDISLGIVAGSISNIKGCCGNTLSASIHVTQDSVEIKFEGQVIQIPNHKAKAGDYLGMRVRKQKERLTEVQFYLGNFLLFERQTKINEEVIYPFVQTFRAGCQFDVSL